MATPQLYTSPNRWMGLGLESGWGTVTAPDIYLQVDPNPSTEPQVTYLENKALYGSAAQVYDTLTGVIHTKVSAKGNAFTDTFGYLPFLALGKDTVSGTVAPYTHTLTLAEAASTGSFPGSVTVTDIDNVAATFNSITGSAKQIPGCVIDSLSITANATGALSYSVDFVGSELGQVTAPSPAFSTAVFVPAYLADVKLNGSSYELIEELSIDVKRSAKAVPTLNGSPAPYVVWPDGIDVTGKFTIAVGPNDANYYNALTRVHNTLLISFTDPVSGYSFTFQMSSVQIKSPKVESSKAWEEVAVSFQANANTTDASTGYSPFQFAFTSASDVALAA